MLRIDVLAGLLLLVGAAVVVVHLISEPREREFSAEVVALGRTVPSSGPASRIYAGKRKLRQERFVNGHSIVTIVDLDRDSVTFLDPQQKTYFRLPHLGDEYESTIADFARLRKTPCGGSYRATNLGAEAVDGRMAEKWRCELKRLPKYMEGIPKKDLRLVFVIDPWHLWYDQEHSLMLRYVLDSGRGRELRNVRIAPQPEHLFAVPPGYSQTKSPFAGALDSLARR